MKKFLSWVAVLTLLVSCMSGISFAESAAKYTTETTKDGWIKVTNDNGIVLGYSPDSGVTIIEDDGYAFKDLNKNGQLDPYEDWRLSYEERAQNSVELMSLTDMAGLRVSPLSMSADPSGDTNLTMGSDEASTLENYILNYGVRYMDNMSYTIRGGSDSILSLVKYSNHIQAVSESSSLGLPYVISADPSSFLMGNTSQMVQASTFDTEAVNQLWQEVSKGLRAVGVTMLLGPQVDLETDPRALTATVFSEDSQLSADMTNAAINGMQSTYDEDGNDLGWGKDSVVCQMKHFAANGAIEGGRSYHYTYGKYSVYPGDAFETQLVPYVDGGFYLTGKTEQTGGIMLSYSIPWSDDGSLGDNTATALNSQIVSLASEYGFDGLIATDAIGVQQYTYDSSAEAATAVNQLVIMFSNGVDQILSGEFSVNDALVAYDVMVAEMGEEKTLNNYQTAAYHAVLIMFRTGIVDNAYLESSESVAFFKNSDLAGTEMNEITQDGIVMLKNNGVISAATDEKKTVYIPMIYEETVSMGIVDGQFVRTVSGEWKLPVSTSEANKYFNVVTDTIDENSTVVRASEEEIAKCDFALVIINNPDTGSGYDDATGTYLPISLQYSTYTADSENVREKSIAGDAEVSYSETPYGIIASTVNENRSYYGQSITASNIDQMELVQETAAKLPENVSLVVCVNSSGAMVFSEIEPYADALFILFGRQMMGGTDMGVFTDPSTDNFLPLVAGQYEPQGLLPLQMPANMETVEAQYEDVPRDMECYVDANGNTYDFTFGMNWSGVINDERVEKYNVPALTAPVHQPVAE